jgi:PKD repeat protein
MPGPIVLFTGTPLSLAVGSLVTFTAVATGDVSTWGWYFGDGTYSNLQNPTHAYTSVGTFSVTVSGTSGGIVGTYNIPNYITTTVPTITFTGSPVSGPTGSTITFTPVTVGTMATWYWLFGDTASSPGSAPTHTYNTVGVYTVSVTGFVSGGSRVSSRSNYVSIADTPTGTFQLSNHEVALGDAVTFTDATSGTPTSWLWNFGDATTSTSQNPSHTYTSVGSYTVTLTSTNVGGSVTSTDSVWVGTTLHLTDSMRWRATYPVGEWDTDQPSLVRTVYGKIDPFSMK